ncbi:hypothetical protein XI06_19555 [Bradyrhizobium sp. CCBAU 11434]|uniref:hypothetical protein n=1 Tax=Bradyrhizobium sp. CCBAU 11434 TaxID=1630885 RepID=UPI0023065774|nr:hypothetical protein [Bradyrhizobium sp. CCBAU 11434]MDA9522417.1 hypothetical protein [Bradyrhizobium sp. CCBAU 11434]
MVPLQIERVVERDIAPREGFLERMEGALLLTSLASVTVVSCYLLGLVVWKCCIWVLQLA